MDNQKSQDWAVVAFYAFTRLDDTAALKACLQSRIEAQGLYGTILLAAEGVNGTIAHADKAQLESFVAFLREHAPIPDRDIKWSNAQGQPFRKLKIRLKKEIITLRQPEADPTIRTGVHVKPADWNALIARDDVLTLDTRNTYETELGLFKGAVDPQIGHFTHFVDYVRSLPEAAKSKPVAMYCTGGIRCEKASAFMLSEGFSEVYQLEGGILRYLEQIPESESLWQGGCFVFDERIALGHGLDTVGTDIVRTDMVRPN
jgi:UPF0176 protein